VYTKLTIKQSKLYFRKKNNNGRKVEDVENWYELCSCCRQYGSNAARFDQRGRLRCWNEAKGRRP